MNAPPSDLDTALLSAPWPGHLPVCGCGGSLGVGLPLRDVLIFKGHKAKLPSRELVCQPTLPTVREYCAVLSHSVVSSSL